MNGPEPTIVAPTVQSFAQFEVLWGYPRKVVKERRLKARSAITQDMTAFTMQQMLPGVQSMIWRKDCRGKGARSRSGGDALMACTQP
jgi:hypothetical protein